MEEDSLSSFAEKIEKNDCTIFEDFRTIVLRNDIELIHRIWKQFPTYAWTCLSGHLFEDLSYRGMYHLIDLFIENNKLWGGACMFKKMYEKDPEKWKARYV